MNDRSLLLRVPILLMAAVATGLTQPMITTQPTSETNFVGATVSFSLVATSTTPLSYQWQFNGVDLSAQTDASLIITSAQLTNQGPYDVVVADAQGSVTSIVANLYLVAPPTIQFGAPTYLVAESAGAVNLAVHRTDWLDTAVTVDYTTIDGSATNGLKYAAVSGTLLLAAGETNKTIVVPILNEGFVEGTKAFRVLLTNPVGGAVLGSPATAIVSINDNDFGIQFAFTNYSVAEDAGAITLRVVRDDDGMLPVTVDFTTGDFTAIRGVDYVAVTTNLTFTAEDRLRLVSIPLLNNGLTRPNRTFRVTLSNPVGASLGRGNIASITVVDSNQGFHFQSSSYAVAQSAGVVELGVLRGTDRTNSELGVDISTKDLTATNGIDYTGLRNTLRFGAGEKLKLVAVPILNDGLKGPNKTFRAILSNPTGTVLSSPASVNVTILNSNPGVGFESTFYTNSWGPTNVTVTVLRGNDVVLAPITVDYMTSDSTAHAGQDYQAISGTLEFQQNETVKSLTIPLLRPRAVTALKSFRVNLSNPTGGAVLSTASASVYIVGKFVTVAAPFSTALTIRQEAGMEVVAWEGGGVLQRAESPAGPWQKLRNAISPFAVRSSVPTSFYRVTRPRPVQLYVPSGYDGQTPVPLVILLHGYTWTGAQQENWMQFQPLAESRTFLYCYPDGTVDPSGNQFWTGTDACCDQWSEDIDDVGFLKGLINEIGTRFALDRKRIYLIGHSNGGYLSYHMACQHADLIAAIASVSGSTFLDPRRCQPSQPVNILQIHGTADQWQFYAGGANVMASGWLANLPPFPSAPQSVQTWAGYNGANGPLSDPAPTFDLTTDVAGLDTVVTRYTNAPPGGAVELWSIVGGTHWPNLTSRFAPLVIDWLLGHPKP